MAHAEVVLESQGTLRGCVVCMLDVDVKNLSIVETEALTFLITVLRESWAPTRTECRHECAHSSDRCFVTRATFLPAGPITVHGCSVAWPAPQKSCKKAVYGCTIVRDELSMHLTVHIPSGVYRTIKRAVEQTEAKEAPNDAPCGRCRRLLHAQTITAVEWPKLVGHEMAI